MPTSGTPSTAVSMRHVSKSTDTLTYCKATISYSLGVISPYLDVHIIASKKDHPTNRSKLTVPIQVYQFFDILLFFSSLRICTWHYSCVISILHIYCKDLWFMTLHVLLKWQPPWYDSKVLSHTIIVALNACRLLPPPYFRTNSS